MKTRFLPLLAIGAFAARAATVQIAGVISDDSGAQISQWRTAATPKTLDADGDHLFGTTARLLFGVGQFG